MAMHRRFPITLQRRVHQGDTPVREKRTKAPSFAFGLRFPRNDQQPGLGNQTSSRDIKR